MQNSAIESLVDETTSKIYDLFYEYGFKTAYSKEVSSIIVSNSYFVEATVTFISATTKEEEVLAEPMNLILPLELYTATRATKKSRAQYVPALNAPTTNAPYRFAVLFETKNNPASRPTSARTFHKAYPLFECGMPECNNPICTYDKCVKHEDQLDEAKELMRGISKSKGFRVKICTTAQNLDNDMSAFVEMDRILREFLKARSRLNQQVRIPQVSNNAGASKKSSPVPPPAERVIVPPSEHQGPPPTWVGKPNNKSQAANELSAPTVPVFTVQLPEDARAMLLDDLSDVYRALKGTNPKALNLLSDIYDLLDTGKLGKRLEEEVLQNREFKAKSLQLAKLQAELEAMSKQTVQLSAPRTELPRKTDSRATNPFQFNFMPRLDPPAETSPVVPTPTPAAPVAKASTDNSAGETKKKAKTKKSKQLTDNNAQQDTATVPTTVPAAATSPVTATVPVTMPDAQTSKSPDPTTTQDANNTANSRKLWADIIDAEDDAGSDDDSANAD